MKKTISAFVAGLAVASIPYLTLGRAEAQGAGPLGGQGGRPGQPAQPGQAGAAMGNPPITTLAVDGDYIYAGAGNWLYKISKHDMKVQQQVSVRPPQRAERPLGGGGQN